MPPPAPIFWKKVDENQVSYFIWPYVQCNTLAKCMLFMCINIIVYIWINSIYTISSSSWENDYWKHNKTRSTTITLLSSARSSTMVVLEVTLTLAAIAVCCTGVGILVCCVAWLRRSESVWTKAEKEEEITKQMKKEKEQPYSKTNLNSRDRHASPMCQLMKYQSVSKLWWIWPASWPIILYMYVHIINTLLWMSSMRKLSQIASLHETRLKHGKTAVIVTWTHVHTQIRDNTVKAETLICIIHVHSYL